MININQHSEITRGCVG